MSDPIIRSYERPLYREEVSDLGEINMNENYFDFGVYFFSYKHQALIELPE